MFLFDLSYILIDTFERGLVYALLALGIFISFRVLNIPDLTAEGSFLIGGAITAVLLVYSVNPWIATILGILGGFGAGVITGLIHTKLGISGLLSGIITMTGLFTINMIIMGLAPNSIIRKAGQLIIKPNTSKYAAMVPLGGLNTKGEHIQDNLIYSLFDGIFPSMNNHVAIIIIGVLIVALFIGILYIVFGTEVGMSIRATGINPNMARAQGINTSLMTILGLGIANALIAASGACFVQIQGSASSTMNVGVLVIGLASIIIGEAIVGKRRFWQWLTAMAVGAIAYYFIVALALQLGLPNYYLKLLYALLILIILASTNFKLFGVNKKRKKATKQGESNA